MTDWQKRLDALKNSSTCRITTRGRKTGRPHTVTIWFTVDDGGRVNLGTLRMGRDWPKNVAANPAVQLQIGDLRLDGEARLVTTRPRARVSRVSSPRNISRRGSGPGSASSRRGSSRYAFSMGPSYL